MNNAQLAELLLLWEEAEVSGKSISIEVLCKGDSECEAMLRQRIRALKSMQWIEQPDEKPMESQHHWKTWHSGQEPVPGYRLVRPLGRGGFSEVWEAEGPRGIPVALKLVFADRSFPEEKSLELLKLIRHPRIVSVFGAWSLSNGFAIAMELADASVFDRWSKLESDTDKRALSEAALVAGAEALDFLNVEHHIQHRDVKPQNLLLFGSYVKIADFGIAKVVEDHSTGHTGFFTVAYAPPEFFRGRSAAESDQYSLAVTYTMLRSGKLPFNGNSASMTYGHLHRRPDLAGLPPEERGAVARAMAKEPKDRWPSCRAFADAVLAKRKIFWLPKTRRQVLAGTAIAIVASVPLITRHFSKPTALKLIRKFEVPPDKTNGLFLRQVVGSVMAKRTAEKLLHYDYNVVGNGMAGAYIWDGHTGKLQWRLSPKPGVGVAIPSTEESWCLTGHNDGSFYAWELDTGKQKRQFDGHGAGRHVTSIDIKPDARQTVTGSTDGTIKTWECSREAEAKLEALRTILINRYVMSVKYVANGSKIVSVGFDGLLQQWDGETGLPLWKIDASDTEIWTLDVSSDGNYALTGDARGVIKLWDVSNRTMIKQFEGHEVKVECVSFSLNKDLVCSGASDRTLRFWNVSNGREEYRATHDSEVYGVSPANVRMNGSAYLTATTETVYAWEAIS